MMALSASDAVIEGGISLRVAAAPGQATATISASEWLAESDEVSHPSQPPKPIGVTLSPIRGLLSAER